MNIAMPAGGRLPAICAGAAALIFLGASVTLNIGYQLTKPDLLSKIVWGAVAAGASVGLALALPALLRSITAKL